MSTVITKKKPAAWKIALICVGAALLVGGIIALALLLTQKSKKYKCDANNQCAQDPNGTYTDSNCGGKCAAPPVQKYACNNTQCVQDPDGTYTDSNCNGQCAAPPVQKYACKNNQCVQYPNGTYNEQTCGGQCAAACPQRPANPDTQMVPRGNSVNMSPFTTDFTDAMDQTLTSLLSNSVKVTYLGPTSSTSSTSSTSPTTLSTNGRMVAYVGDFISQNSSFWSTLWSKWFPSGAPSYSITGTPDWPFLYMPQLGSVSNLSNPNLTYGGKVVPWAQDVRTVNGIPGVLIENANGGSYRVYMGQPPSMQASERFADNGWGFHNPNASNLTDPRNTFYSTYKKGTSDSALTTFMSGRTDSTHSAKGSDGNCYFYQANVISKSAPDASQWANGPCINSATCDTLFVDFTDDHPLNGEFGVPSGGGYNAKGFDIPNPKNNPDKPIVLIKKGADVGGGVKKNVLELRTYVAFNGKIFTIPLTGGLISSKKWASGRYEVRAKVANRPSLVWAIWTFWAVYKLPSPLSGCGAYTCADCLNMSDYSTCCDTCNNTTTPTLCGTCSNSTSKCSDNTNCPGGKCLIPDNPAQCYCQQCVSKNTGAGTRSDSTGIDCRRCSWKNNTCTGDRLQGCNQYTNENDCTSFPCNMSLGSGSKSNLRLNLEPNLRQNLRQNLRLNTLKNPSNTAAPPLKTPWDTTPIPPENPLFVGSVAINDPTTAGTNYKTAVSTATVNGVLLGGLPCSSYPNQEIDIEIPSNAPFFSSMYSSANPIPPDTVMPTAHTFNLNTYRWSNSDGTGTYQNLYTERQSEMKNASNGDIKDASNGDIKDASNGDIKDAMEDAMDPPPFIGDGCYHTYAFEWHTGDDAKGIRPKVDFFFDGDYCGTSDAFVPDVFQRLWLGSWDCGGRPSGNWNGRLGANATVWDDVAEAPTATTAPTDGSVALYSVNYIDYIKITPFFEANDRYVPEPLDQENMNQALDLHQHPLTGDDTTNADQLKPGSCCALVQQKNPYDSSRPDVQMCVEYSKDSYDNFDWTNPVGKRCMPPLNPNTAAPDVKSQVFIPFFQTQTTNPNVTDVNANYVIWNASTSELPSKQTF